MSRRATDGAVTAHDVLGQLAPQLRGLTWPQRATPQRWTAPATPKGQSEARAVEDLLLRAEAAADAAARQLRATNADHDLSETGKARRRANVLRDAAAAIREDIARTLPAFEARRLQVDADVAAARRATVEAAATPEQRREIRDVLRGMDPAAARQLVDQAVRGQAPDVAAALLDTAPAIRLHLQTTANLNAATFEMLESAVPITDQTLAEQVEAHRHAAGLAGIYQSAAQSLDRRIGELTAATGEAPGAA